MNQTLLVAILGVLGMVAVALINRRASPYDALAKRIVDLEVSDAKKGEEITKLRSEIESLRDHDRKRTTAQRAHVEWDNRVMATMTPEQAAALGAPPPLYTEEG